MLDLEWSCSFVDMIITLNAAVNQIMSCCGRKGVQIFC
jgi:hypothetical protein